MKTFLSTHRRRSPGSALVIVLSCLVFVTVVVVAFVTSMRQQVVASRAGADASGVRHLAETTVNVAIAQVQDATKRAAANGEAWASQPGMIRLYNTAGAPAAFYKLYSWTAMNGVGAFQPQAASEIPPLDWHANSGAYVDLNAPVIASARNVYPILDPVAIDANPAEGAPSSVLAIDQFFLNSPPGAPAGNPVPMPVRWLYLLADGTLHVPAGTGSRAVVAEATAANPIVGRLAFWTDDESCKININTASVGLANSAVSTAAGYFSAASYSSFWDVPRFCFPLEATFAMAPPAVREYQRYPGHPATVGLNTVFPASTAEQIRALLNITPRYAAGGSEGGTRTLRNPGVGIDAASLSKRLYASTDEFLFAPERTVNSDVTRDLVNRADFFITAVSRAPELNLFGRPRVSIWPVNANPNLRTATDRLLARAATVGNVGSAGETPFYFTRANPLSTTADISIARNRTLLSYLDTLTDRPIPGFGGTFADKWQADKRQILTQVFDYIRCTNVDDSSSGASRFAPSGSLSSINEVVPSFHPDWLTQGFGGRFPMVNEMVLQFVGLGEGTSTPVIAEQVGQRVGMASENTPGSGQMAVQGFFLLNFLVPGQSFAKYHPRLWVEIDGLDQLRVQHPSLGLQSWGFPSTGAKVIDVNWSGVPGIAGQVGSIDFRALTSFNNTILSRNPADNAQRRTHFPFYSNIIALPAGGTMDVEGGQVTVRLYALTSTGARGDLVQTLRVDFPGGTFPVPRLAANRRIGVPGVADRWDDLSVNSPGVVVEADRDTVRSILVASGDTRLLARNEITAAEGLFSAHPAFNTLHSDPGGTVFNMQAYATRVPIADQAANRNFPGTNSNYGRLISGASFNPNISLGIRPLTGSAVPGVGGDWDNGVAQFPDGPFINQADEGTLISASYFGNVNVVPYFTAPSVEALGSAYFSPNRMVSSPGMFGSLPTGVLRRQPWQTLLFRPGPAGHPGSDSPGDHLLLDLFWMPVAEPYAISEPFSTAGKININQQIVPFTYIERFTGLRAALASEMVAAVPVGRAGNYKVHALGAANTWPADVSRRPLNLDPAGGSLRGVAERFASGEIFRSATEICRLFLVPQGSTWTTDEAARTAWYGNDFALVGDNTRERPYANLYGKLTTRSNTFTVHYHVQVLRKSRVRQSSAPTVFDPAEGDQIASEERGSSTFERYLDPADPRLVTADPATTDMSLDGLYRVRIINSKVFNP